MLFLHGAICLRCFTCIFIQTKNPSCMLSLSTSLYNKALSISLTKSFKRSRPIRLQDSNPLVLAYQANSLTISELQLRVFQIKNREDRLYSIMSSTSSQPSWIFTISQTFELRVSKTLSLAILLQLNIASLPTFACRQFLPIEVAKGLHGLFVHSLKWSEMRGSNSRTLDPKSSAEPTQLISEF